MFENHVEWGSGRTIRLEFGVVAIEERVARIEGGYEHLATKADLERMVLRLVLAQIAIGGAIVAVLRFWS